jgi:hypothetical protein
MLYILRQLGARIAQFQRQTDDNRLFIHCTPEQTAYLNELVFVKECFDTTLKSSVEQYNLLFVYFEGEIGVRTKQSKNTDHVNISFDLILNMLEPVVKATVLSSINQFAQSISEMGTQYYQLIKPLTTFCHTREEEITIGLPKSKDVACKHVTAVSMHTDHEYNQIHLSVIPESHQEKHYWISLTPELLAQHFESNDLIIEK